MSPELTRTSTFLPAAQPFDFGATLAFIRGFPPKAGEQRTTDDALTLAVREAGVLAGARLTAEQAGLRCELVSDTTIDEPALTAIRDRLTCHLGLDDDLTEFYGIAADDPAFRPVVARLHGYHQVKFASPLELLCWAILSQRTPLPVARKMKQAIVAACGNRIALDGDELWAFPDIDQMLELGPERLLELIGNERKARFLHGAVGRWAKLDETFLRTGDYDEVLDRLLELPGIGPWSATFLLIRGLGRAERVTPDKEALRAAARTYGRPISEAEFNDLAARYGTWQGYWAHYLRAQG